MKLFKPTRLAIFGAGFLAGSRAGRGAWDTVQGKVTQLQNKTGGGTSTAYGNGKASMDSPTGGETKGKALSEF